MSKILKVLNVIIKSFALLVVIFLLASNSNNKLIKSSNSNYSLTLDLDSMSEMLKEAIANDIYAVRDTYTGYLTGYVATCPLCSGHLACMPSLDVLHGNNKYNDATYGELNIVASSTGTKCGTVIRINNSRISNKPVYAIVLDRGVGGNNLDFLTNTESDAYFIGRSLVSYDILRDGWE